jgi:hypothetical protein
MKIFQSFGFILQQLHGAFQSIKEYQSEDAFCDDMRLKVENGDISLRNYRLHDDVLVYLPAKTIVKRYVVPIYLRPMVLDYCHDSTTSQGRIKGGPAGQLPGAL